MKILFSKIVLLILALLLLLFLYLGNSFIYNNQRAYYNDSLIKSQQTDMKLLSQLTREGLITRNYALIEWFFNQWGIDYKSVVRLSLETQNGFALSKYTRREAATGRTISASRTISIHDGSYTISLITDTSGIDKKLEELKLQLILVNTGVFMLTILNVWFLFRHFAIRHLKLETKARKIAEEKLRQLEKNAN